VDNLTHSLTGLVVAKAGLERLSPGAAAVCVITANAPDFDLLYLLGGRWTYLENHRGITHSILGVLVLVVLVPTLFYLGEILLARFRKRPRRIRYGGLVLASLVAGVTHPLMDWTNNYGIRLLLPWSGQWFYGDLVFIIDLGLWIVLGGAAFLLTSRTKGQVIVWSAIGALLTLGVFLLPQQREAIPHVNIFRVLWVIILLSFFFARRARVGQRLRSSIAIAAIVVVIGYWTGLAFAHQRAFASANRLAGELATPRGESVIRVAAMPTLANPFRWQCISETERATYRYHVSLLRQAPLVFERFEKPNAMELRAIEAASRDERTKVFLGFARFPAMRLQNADCLSQTVVQFADLRYTEPGGGQRGTFSLEVPVACPEVEK
jgi:inner membrane protein